MKIIFIKNGHVEEESLRSAKHLRYFRTFEVAEASRKLTYQKFFLP